MPGGRELGAYLVAHPRIDKISFTGSTVAGRSIGEACGRLLRPVTLELGGKSAAIVLDDAKLELEKVDNNHTIAQEEIFGPVLSLIPYTDEDEAIRISNDSEYGLGGTVWTADPDRGVALAKRVQTGTIGINTYLPDPTAPFGGVKASGIGRELGPEALANYQQLKSVYLG